ncbi:MAG: serine/threonine protein kinase [Synechococcales cyanobacterium RU_4_20]|nr:serine/threonine protein kinase [Synechococcales cyanobacterium RU_4_20]
MLKEGDRIQEHYQIVAELGRKAGRRTLLAEDLRSHTNVVIKLLSFSDEFTWDDLKLFEREAETLKSLQHPQIPQYLDFFEFSIQQRQYFALVQSYIEELSLEQHIQLGRRFSEEDLQRIARDLLEILDYLHRLSPPVIHRDIKPSNILLGDRSAHSPGRVYLVDFGSVQTLAAHQGSTITIVGTYGYMPPEQFGGHAFPSSDLYALGATLLHAATGRSPAELDIIDGSLTTQLQPELSGSLQVWLTNLCAASPHDRPQDAASAELFLDSLIAEGKAMPVHLQETFGLNETSIIESNSTYFRIITKDLKKDALTLPEPPASLETPSEQAELISYTILVAIFCLLPILIIPFTKESISVFDIYLMEFFGLIGILCFLIGLSNLHLSLTGKMKYPLIHQITIEKVEEKVSEQQNLISFRVTILEKRGKDRKNILRPKKYNNFFYSSP